MKIPRILKILLFVTFVKGIFWVLIVPPFQWPDEQNHFALVQFYANQNKRPDPVNLTVSKELYETTQILNFDWSGRHPMWNSQNAFTDAKSKDEKIGKIPYRLSSLYVAIANGSKNPPLYYQVGSQFYKMGSNSNILNRLFFSRMFSTILGIISVLATYLLTLKITKKENFSITVASIVSFLPSFTALSSYVTNDSLAITSSTLAILAIINQVSKTNSLKNNIIGAVSGFLCLITRVHLGVLLILSLGITLVRTSKINPGKLTLILAVTVLLLFALNIPENNENIFFRSTLPFGLPKYLEGLAFFNSIIHNGQLVSKILPFLQESLPHYLNEVFPWYFGVFGWLEVTLPPGIYTVFKVFTIISLLGFILKIKNVNRELSVSVLAAIALALIIIFADFMTYVTSGEGIGVQGRHMLPGVAVHIILLMIGIEAWISRKALRIERLISVGAISCLNLLSIFKIYEYFYSPKNLDDLLIKLTFYKPTFLNNNLLILIFLFYISLTLLFLLELAKLKQDE